MTVRSSMSSMGGMSNCGLRRRLLLRCLAWSFVVEEGGGQGGRWLPAPLALQPSAIPPLPPMPTPALSTSPRGICWGADAVGLLLLRYLQVK